ncbi:hypothetical protein L1049_022033 [Liquidambar formosana]|uniref:Sulfotransferase n=1 Tax=Liquidambar formosana TaxID=63359 RepID=A0AAP0WPR3_LIQFO
MSVSDKAWEHNQTCVPKPNEDEDDKEKAKEEDCCQQTNQKYDDIFSTLPKERGWRTEHLMQYQDTWLPSGVTTIKIVTSFQQHFKALPTAIILATYPKSGTTWFKALIFAIMNRARFEISLHPLLTTNPQDCIPTIEELTYDLPFSAGNEEGVINRIAELGARDWDQFEKYQEV